MPDNNEKNKPKGINENITGRVDNPGEKFKEEQGKSDISNMDRQEGTMDHGELGANFSSENNNQKDRDPNKE